jgi:hypothetical protein
MAISISNSLRTTSSVASSSPSTPATAEPAQKAAVPAVTVKLSQAAQVHLLKQQGQSLSQIASSLSIPMTAVDGYLGIQVPKATSTSTQPPAQAPESAATAPAIPATPAKG